MKLNGLFSIICRDSKGSVKWRREVPNGVVNQGLNYALSSALAGGTPITTWFIGLISGSSAATLSPSDTLASHPGWEELSGYDEVSRQTWTPGAVAAQSVDNSASKATFTFTSGATISGLFLASESTKGGTSGTLYSTALFSSAQQPADGDSIEITYKINAGA